jgi:hypothetical protein
MRFLAIFVGLLALLTVLLAVAFGMALVAHALTPMLGEDGAALLVLGVVMVVLCAGTAAVIARD